MQSNSNHFYPNQMNEYGSSNQNNTLIKSEENKIKYQEFYYLINPANKINICNFRSNSNDDEFVIVIKIKVLNQSTSQYETIDLKCDRTKIVNNFNLFQFISYDGNSNKCEMNVIIDRNLNPEKNFIELLLKDENKKFVEFFTHIFKIFPKDFQNLQIYELNIDEKKDEENFFLKIYLITLDYEKSLNQNSNLQYFIKKKKKPEQYPNQNQNPICNFGDNSNFNLNNNIQPIQKPQNQNFQYLNLQKFFYQSAFEKLLSALKTNNSSLNYEDSIFFKKGLTNIGSTCYMNSVLQLLLHIPELTKYFIKFFPENQKTFEKIFKKMNKDFSEKNTLSINYYNFLKEVETTKKKSIEPNNMKKIIGNLNSQFKSLSANDSKDLLLFILEQMHEELNINYNAKNEGTVVNENQTDEMQGFKNIKAIYLSTNISIISSLFYGIIESTTVCSSCGNKIFSFQYSQFLSFSLAEYNGLEFNIYQGFNDMQKPLQTDNYYCNYCHKLSNSFNNNCIAEPSFYLFINLDYGRNKIYKPSKLTFKETIQIGNYISYNPNQDKFEYKLLGLSKHLGRDGSWGHYISYIRDRSNKWWLFNDSIVTQCHNIEDVFDGTPYILIYEKANK